MFSHRSLLFRIPTCSFLISFHQHGNFFLLISDRHKRDPKRWKANFRCAIKSLKEVKELTSESATKGQNAYRVFQIRGMTGQCLSKTPGRRGDDDDEEDTDDNDGNDKDDDKERNVNIPGKAAYM